MGKSFSLKDDVSFKYLFLNETVCLYFISDALGIPLEAKRKNIGIIEAIREVRTMRFGKTFKALHEAHMKQIRDRNARDDYVRMEGRAEGHASGLTEGIMAGEDRMNRLVLSLMQAGRQEDIEKVARDKEYRDRLYEEYGI